MTEKEVDGYKKIEVILRLQRASHPLRVLQQPDKLLSSTLIIVVITLYGRAT